MCTHRTQSHSLARLEITTKRRTGPHNFSLAVIIFWRWFHSNTLRTENQSLELWLLLRLLLLLWLFSLLLLLMLFFRVEQNNHKQFFSNSLSLSLANWSILFYAILNYNYFVFSCLFLLAAYSYGDGGMNRCVVILSFFFVFLAIFSNRNRCQASVWVRDCVSERIRKLWNVRDEIHVRTIVLTFIIRPFLYLPLKHYSSVRQLIDSFSFALFFFSFYTTLLCSHSNNETKRNEIFFFCLEFHFNYKFHWLHSML